ncbi:MAG: GNAT family N-acetyltransferase [Cystobacter sp.]
MDPVAMDFGPLRDDRERSQVEDILVQSFAMTPESSRAWLRKAEATGAWVEVLREKGAVTATASLIPMGQWWWGRRVPVGGVAGVGVAPAHRGQGTAGRLMLACLQEMRARGCVLSALYPATQPLYRRAGFEQAGVCLEHRVRLSGIDLAERSLSLRPVEEADLPMLADVYLRHARSQPGWLDRGPYIWNRIQHPKGGTANGFLVEGASGVEGYLFLTRREVSLDHKQELNLSDLVALTPAAGRRLLSFLGDHRSLGVEVVWLGGPSHPLLFLLREQSHQMALRCYWMLRVLDVAGALQARGYPPGLSAALHLEVEDDLFPENQGRFVLEVEGGEAEVRRGGEGDLKLHARALAPLFSGFLSPTALHLAGALSADEATLRTAESIFSGPAPAMPDMF